MFKEISPNELSGNVFDYIGDRWMLICAQDGSGANLMTASWGGLGVIWTRPASFIFVRPQRYTKKLVDAAAGYSLLFFDEIYREQLNLCGVKSGRDIDKFAACNFTLDFHGGIPYAKEAERAIFCRKLYTQDMLYDCFNDKDVAKEIYPKEDYHTMYVGEVTSVLVKD